MKIRMHLTIGYSGADHEEEIEVEDDCSPDELEGTTSDWAHNHIEYWHEVVE